MTFFTPNYFFSGRWLIFQFASSAIGTSPASSCPGSDWSNMLSASGPLSSRCGDSAGEYSLSLVTVLTSGPRSGVCAAELESGYCYCSCLPGGAPSGYRGYYMDASGSWSSTRWLGLTYSRPMLSLSGWNG